ncbi:transcriptional regulator with XRE-family HTH domain [Rhodanobacter sp. K2T2]|uniref:helix-turn-helix domain-containing protein n=1 Tax=Rhodanobacter sp. K2T2 TaxID=2723085 RepID=UPI0015CC53B8|nr:helix-turn-helix transcriptional regulator [Rhodanobacter sp. K2T2]NYE30040.1 transcriptional regulator with XRE-family HTH domain [Rhodanobacter sp. K2T2]
MKRTSLYSERHAVLVEYLRELRVLRHLTQAEVAETIGRPQTYVSDIEKGKRGLDLLQVLDLCEAYDVSLPAFSVELDQRLKKLAKPSRRTNR